MEPKETHEFGQEVVFRQHRFSLMSVEWLEVFASHERFGETLLDIVLLKHGKPDQI